MFPSQWRKLDDGFLLCEIYSNDPLHTWLEVEHGSWIRANLSCVLRAIAALSTLISRWVKAVESFQMSIWWSGKESKKSWSSWEGPSCRKDSGRVEVSPLLMTSSGAWLPPHLVCRWSSRACICGGETELSSLTGSGPQNC